MDKSNQTEYYTVLNLYFTKSQLLPQGALYCWLQTILVRNKQSHEPLPCDQATGDSGKEKLPTVWGRGKEESRMRRYNGRQAHYGRKSRLNNTFIIPVKIITNN